MEVLRHEHILTLVDLNPGYPHDEQVYDDEYDLIIKQAFHCQCNLCRQEITFLHRYYYNCDQCDYSIHKSCAELPTTLRHTSHSVHTFILFQDESQWLCHICDRHPLCKPQLCFHCSQCVFNICLDCGMNEVQSDTIYHPRHLHPLVPINREILTSCDACGKEHKGVFYLCTTCLYPFIYSVCVFQPKRLLIQESTCGRFFHTHPLILKYSFPKQEQKQKFYPVCRICDNSFSDNDNLWVYKCDKCRYYVHLHCANLRCEPTNSGVATTSKGYEGKPYILRLPLSGETKTLRLLTDYLYTKTNEKCIKIEGHDHPLTVVDTIPKVQDLCDLCVRPIMDVPFYKCTLGCNFVVHEWCTRLPNEIIGHPDQPRHILTLMHILTPLITDRIMSRYLKCFACSHDNNGAFYFCYTCSRKHGVPYQLDVHCAFTPEEIIHKSHPHLLSKARRRKKVDKDYCRICLSGFTGETETNPFSCQLCNFHLHIKCALLLPETIMHKYDKHPMTLCYQPIENHEGDYYCEVCEEEFNPNASFYHCHECVQSIHSACVPLPHQTKPYIDNDFSGKAGGSKFKNIKFGVVYETKSHPHPLSCLFGTQSDGDCTNCGRRLEGDIMFKCLQCKFAIHEECCIVNDLNVSLQLPKVRRYINRHSPPVHYKKSRLLLQSKPENRPHR